MFTKNKKQLQTSNDKLTTNVPLFIQNDNIYIK